MTSRSEAHRQDAVARSLAALTERVDNFTRFVRGDDEAIDEAHAAELAALFGHAAREAEASTNPRAAVIARANRRLARRARATLHRRRRVAVVRLARPVAVATGARTREGHGRPRQANAPPSADAEPEPPGLRRGVDVRRARREDQLAQDIALLGLVEAFLAKPIQPGRSLRREVTR